MFSGAVCDSLLIVLVNDFFDFDNMYGACTELRSSENLCLTGFH